MTGLTEVENEFCRSFTKELLECPLCHEFRKPVDPEAPWAAEYFRIIAVPMDLSTIVGKLESQKYTSALEWFNDLNLVWQNAMAFNKKPAFLWFVADFMQKKCERKCSRIPRTESDALGLRLEKLHKDMKKLLAFDVPPHSLLPKERI
jgi:hypothetical protein